MNISDWQKAAVFIVVTATALMFLAALWVPIRIDFHEPYLGVNLFTEIRPRALLGTVGQFLRLGPLGFNYLKYTALYFWLLLIIYQVYQSVLGRGNVEEKGFFVFIGLSFIFAFNTVTVMTFGPGFIDVAPYALVALAIILFDRISQPISWSLVVAITLLLLMAVLAHEKSIFDVAICFVWILWKKGLRNALVYIAPGILLALLFLISVSSEGTKGLQPQGYADILLSGFTFMFQHSLNVWGIVGGGGALWFLYIIFTRRFINEAGSKEEARRRFLTASSMALICLATLVVAADTNRMIGLMWLPVVLLMREVDVNSIFQSAKSGIGMVVLCVLQFFNPPILMYNNGVVPFNCYALGLVSYLPAEENVAPLTMGPFGMYVLSRPDLTGTLQERCSNTAGN